MSLASFGDCIRIDGRIPCLEKTRKFACRSGLGRLSGIDAVAAAAVDGVDVVDAVEQCVWRPKGTINLG